MFVQHMLAVLRPDGMVATVMPHGVLFRGGDEGEIRTGLLERRPASRPSSASARNLFYGTGIPACILVLRAAGLQAAGAQGQGAVHQRRPRVPRGPGAELPGARAHREDRLGLSRLRGRPRLRPRRQSRRAARERRQPQHPPLRRHHADHPSRRTCGRTCTAASRRPRSRPRRTYSPRTVSIPISFFVPKDEAYFHFADVVSERRDLRRSDRGRRRRRRGRGRRLRAIGLWWNAEEARFDKLQSAADLVDLRKELIETFRDALDATPLLDPFAISGIIASWWGVSLPDLKALATHRLPGADRGLGRHRA